MKSREKRGIITGNIVQVQHREVSSQRVNLKSTGGIIKNNVIIILCGLLLGTLALGISNIGYFTESKVTVTTERTVEQIAKDSWTLGCADSTVRAARVAPDVIGDEERATEIARMYCNCYFQEVLDRGIGLEEISRDMNNEDTKAGMALIKAKDTCYEKYHGENLQ